LGNNGINNENVSLFLILEWKIVWLISLNPKKDHCKLLGKNIKTNI
jgi:hypothetical protein